MDPRRTSLPELLPFFALETEHRRRLRLQVSRAFPSTIPEQRKEGEPG